jgi:hypothetical protein
MRLLRIFALSVIALVGLGSIIASGSGSNGSFPTDPDVLFATFPSGYFTDGFREAYSFTGTDTAGGTYKADMSIQTGAQTTFNGTPAIPISAISNLTNTQTQAFITETIRIYYSTNINDLRFLGSEDLTSGVVSTAVSTTAIPKTARIGEFGNVGTYTNSAGDTDVETWQISDGLNGLAFFAFFTSTTNQSGNFDSTSEEKYLIAENGDHLSLDFRFFDESSGHTIKLIGTKTL